MKSTARFFLLFSFTVFLACGGGSHSGSGGDSGNNGAQGTPEPDPKDSIKNSVSQYLDLWAKAILARDTNALGSLLSTDFMNYGLDYTSRVSAIKDILNQMNITSYSVKLVSVEAYDGVNASVKIRTTYTYDWLLSPGCSPSIDRTSISHLTEDGAGGWLNIGNQDSSYAAPSSDKFAVGTGSSTAKCISFDDRVTGKKDTFGPHDYAIYAMYHVKNVLGPSLGSYEWVRPDGSLHFWKKFSFKASSNRYTGWSVSAVTRISGNVSLFNNNEGEWKLVGHVKGKNGSADFVNTFNYSANAPSKTSRSSKPIINEANDPPHYSLVQSEPILR